MKKVKPSASLVISAIALFVALGGGAYAATGLISHTQLASNSVWHNNIGNGSVWHNSIGNGSVQTNNLHNGSVGHNQLKSNSVWHANIGNGSVQKNNLSSSVQTQLAAGGFNGAFYSVQQYSGTTSPGAIVTVACDPTSETNSQKYIAISGGVQASDDNTAMTANTGQLPVAASFPGRMNFTTSTPIAGRLDGWIIQFGHQGTSDTNISVWALCAPVSIPVMTHSANPAPY